jgi:transcriptional regulator GlxA family with amidase domain
MSLTAAFPLYSKFDTLDVMGPLQAFLYGGITSTLVAGEPGGVTSLEGITVQATGRFDSCTQYDILFVPGGADIPSVLDLGPRGANPYLDFLERQAGGAKLVCSVCTGALLLAAAGLLDGRTVTTHWAYKDVLRLFPCNVVDDYRRYVHSGNVITGGGISSGIDEALYIISVAAGIDPARRAQLAMQYNPQPILHCGDPGQPDIQDVPELPSSIQSDWDVAGTERKVQQWLAAKGMTAHS